MGGSPFDTIGSEPAQKEDYDNKQFSSLEERIFEVDGRDYEYHYLNVCLEQFQYNAIKTISQNTGANKPDTIARTAEHGLWVLRNNGTLDKANSVREMVGALERLTADDIEHMEIAESVNQTIESHSIDGAKVSPENLTEQVKTKMKDSMYAESVDRYTDSIFSSKAMMIRTLLSAGITDSEQRMRRSKSMAEKQIDAFTKQIEEAQKKIEMELFTYLLTKKVVWEGREIDEYEKEQLEIIAENTRTDYGRRAIEECEEVYW